MEVQEAELKPNQLRKAIRLEAITLAWMVIEAVVSIWAGLAAGSVLLMAFGIDSVIELASAAIVLWRLRHEAGALPGDEKAMERMERRTARIGSYLLFALAAYVVVQAGYGLYQEHAAENSWLGIAVAAVAALGTPLLARAKLRVAEEICSPALRADAVETLACGYMAWVVLAGLGANALLGWWWLDSAAALLLAPLLAKEGLEAVRGEHCDHSCDAPRE